MFAKEYLLKLKKLDVQIRQREEQIMELRCAAEKITPTLGTVPVGGGANDRVGNAAAKLADLEQDAMKTLEKKCELYSKIINQLHGMDDMRFEQILYKKYVEDKSLKQISAEMNYTYDYTRRLHGYALIALEKNLRKEDTQ